MNTNKEEMRELAALLYSVVLSTMSGNELKSSVQQLVKTAKDNHVMTFFLSISCSFVVVVTFLMKMLIF